MGARYGDTAANHNSTHFFGVVNQTLTHFFGRLDRKLFLTSVPILPWVGGRVVHFISFHHRGQSPAPAPAAAVRTSAEIV